VGSRDRPYQAPEGSCPDLGTGSSANRESASPVIPWSGSLAPGEAITPRFWSEMKRDWRKTVADSRSAANHSVAGAEKPFVAAPNPAGAASGGGAGGPSARAGLGESGLRESPSRG